MRSKALLICTSFALGIAASPGLAGDFPYAARVVGGSAEVLSGPGAQYYATAELPAGSTVEVYQHTPSGFCAVRPPEGSFSWVPASAARSLQPGVAEVTRPQAPARVGSLLNGRRDAVHVRLDEGERLRVLGEKEIDGVKWLRVAPPSGEFRWVKRESLAPLSKAPRFDNAEPAPSADSGWVRTATHVDQPPAKPAPEKPQEGPPPQKVSVEVTGVKPINRPQAASGPHELKLTGGFAERMTALEIALSHQVAEMPTLWNLGPLEQKAAELMTIATNEDQRAAVRSYAARVDRFAAVANRYRAYRETPPNVALTKRTTPYSAVTPMRPSANPADYDAVGMLRPVVSKRAGAPQFALVDQAGKIVTFVTARPDINLSQLVGSRVGVQGAKGYMPEYQRQHLTAERVAQLEGIRK